MNILVVGGSGFIGQHLISELSKKDADIHVICRRRRKFSYFDISKLPNVTIHYGTDVLDYGNLQKYFEGIDVVFNLAAYLSFRQADKKKLFVTNRDGTLNVLRACEQHNVKKLIHISSTAALGFSDEVIDETYRFNWNKHKKCVYSISKHLPNKDVMRSRVNSIIIYPPLVLGPGDDFNTVNFLSAIKNRKIPFNTPGKNSVVDVRDLVSALILVMETDIQNERFIVSGGNYSFKQINSVIAEEVDAKPPKFTAPKAMLYPLLGAALLLEKTNKNPPTTYENVFLSFKNRMHSSGKICELGFRPKYSLQQTIQDSWAWMNESNREVEK